MRIAVCSTHTDLAAAVRRFHKEHRFLCAISDPISETIRLYAANTAAVDAVIAARADHPKGIIVGEYEYLSPDVLKALATAKPSNPVGDALKHLGKVASDTDHFELPQLTL